MNPTLETVTHDIRRGFEEVCVISDALETLGDLIHRRHCSADLDSLSERDMEGLALSVRGLALVLGHIRDSSEEAVIELEKLQGVRRDD
ncbi:MAG: hypothetical protein CME40_03125 [Haliea sp.]|nr:hypothetical protein [Haliea sp.]|tara:strand:+ start:168759 stop:169025 length:267 start_codon:yes stop_codon:yes gene_type:complete